MRLIAGFIAFLSVLIFCFGLFGNAKSHKRNEWQAIPLPQLSGSPAIFRVVYAVNPRFSRRTRDQLNALLGTARVLIRDNFHIDIEFEEIHETSIEELFPFLQK